MNFVKSNFWEIDRSPILYHFGAILSILHIFNYFFWKTHSPFLAATTTKPLLCWEFFTNCTQHSLISSALPPKLFAVYLIVAILAFVLFIWRRFIQACWTLLFVTTLIHLFLYVTDASLRSDIQGFLLFLNLCFLFVPNKASIIRITIILFYFLSAYHELSPEWLSGIHLSKAIPLPYKGLEWVAAVGIAVKLTLPFLLVSPFGQRLTLAVIGLLAYHGFHFYFERDFASVTMIFMMFFFVIDYFVRKKMEFETLYQSYAHPEPSKLWWPIVAGFYLAIQTSFIPKTLPTDIFHVLGPTSTSDCNNISFAYFKDHVEQLTLTDSEALDPSVRCHPLVAFNGAKDICAKDKENPQFKTIASYFLSRKFSDKEFHTVFATEDICADDLTYKAAVVNR
jgi:hypothetical protein